MDAQQIKDLTVPSLIIRLTIWNTMTLLFQEILAQDDEVQILYCICILYLNIILFISHTS